MSKFSIFLLSTAILSSVVLSDHIPSTCSPTFCGTYGSSMTCQSLYGSTTCAIYATTSDAHTACRFLPTTCNNSCYFIPVYGSDGLPYCTSCHLHVYSCTTGFTVYGPIPHPITGTHRKEEISAETIEDETAKNIRHLSRSPSKL